MTQQTMLLLAIVSFGGLILDSVDSFYLSQLTPHEYELGDSVQIKVNKLDSVLAQSSYNYYDLPFCNPKSDHAFSGDTLKYSPYTIEMNNPKECVAVCNKTYSKQDLMYFITKIEQQYRINLYVDNLLAGQKFKTITTTKNNQEIEDYIYKKGYPLGMVVVNTLFRSKRDNYNGNKIVMLNNHVDLIILYQQHTSAYTGTYFSIVGFEVQPRSINHKYDATNSFDCSENWIIDGMKIANPTIPDTLDVIWTYSVLFKQTDDINRSFKFDDSQFGKTAQYYFEFSNENSLVTLICFGGMAAQILWRVLYKDNTLEIDAYELDATLPAEAMWMSLNGDVFRAPSYPQLFAWIIGSGVQVISMLLLTLLFGMLGLLSSNYRYLLLISILLTLLAFMGVLGGYCSARCYTMFGGQKQSLLWIFLFPSINFTIFFVLNLLLWHQSSINDIKFGIICSLLIIWFGISVPLVYVGTYFGSKNKAPNFPCETNEVPRIIPAQPWYKHKYFTILVGGILSFSAIFLQMFYILSSVWVSANNSLIVFIILILISAEITIVMIHSQLCAQDHKWWWPSIFTAGSSSLYLFLYSVYYFYSKSNIESFVPTALYFGCMLLASGVMFLVAGTVGFVTAFIFVRKIYGSFQAKAVRNTSMM